MKTKRILAFLIAMIMMVGLMPAFAFADDEVEPEDVGETEVTEETKGGLIPIDPIDPGSGSITPIAKESLYYGWAGHDTKQLTAKITGEITWSSSDEAVATVVGNGRTAVVTATGVGTVTITATNENEETNTFKINVLQYVEVTGVTLNKTALELNVQQYETLTATISPDNSTCKTVTWSSSDDTVATVESTTGKVTAVAEGEATITATTEDGKSATCAVTVITRHVTGLSFTTSLQQACPDYMWVGRDETINIHVSPMGTNDSGYILNYLADPTCTYTVTDITGTDVIEVVPHDMPYCIQYCKIIPKNPGTAKLTVTSNDNPEVSISTTFTVVEYESCDITIVPTVKYVEKNAQYYQTITAKVKYDGGKTGVISKGVHVRRISGTSATVSSTQQPQGWPVTAGTELGDTTYTAYFGTFDDPYATADFTIKVVEDASLYPTGVSINPSAVVVFTDEQLSGRLNAEFTPDTAIYGHVASWTSSDESIATITADETDDNVGIVLCQTNFSSCTITATTDEGYIGRATVYFTDADTFAWTEGYAPSEEMLVGEEKVVKCSLQGIRSIPGLTLTSDNDEVAFAMANLKETKIVAKTPGTATFTVTCSSQPKVTLATFTVTVRSGNENLGASNDPDALFDSEIKEIDDGLLASLPKNYTGWNATNYPVLLDEHYANYFFYGYCDLKGDMTTDRNKATHAKFMTKDLFRVGIQFRFTPIDGDPDQVTDVRFITTIAEKTEGRPQTFTAIGFLVKVEDNTTPAANHTFSKPFYKEIRGDYKPVDINQWAKGISQMFALQTVTGMPNAFFEDEGTVLHVNAIFVTLDGTVVNGPVKNIRVLYDENGNKTATPDQSK